MAMHYRRSPAMIVPASCRDPSEVLRNVSSIELFINFRP
jgi:hypothetical protein